MKHFNFIEDDMDEEAIKSTPKQEYKNKIKQKVKEAAFKDYMKMKQNHSKLDDVHYTDLKIQPYLQSNQFSREEQKLLHQRHVFVQSYPVMSQTTASNQILNYNDIFRNANQQKHIIKIFQIHPKTRDEG